MPHHGFGTGFVLFAVLRGVIELGLLVAVIVLCVWAVRRFTRSRGFVLNQLDPAERLLRRRYAAGELDREEFLTRLADLRGASGPPPGSPQEPTQPQSGAPSQS